MYLLLLEILRVVESILSKFKLQDSMSKTFRVSGIPTLIFIDGQTGKVITKDGRSVVTEDPTGLEFPWSLKDITELIPGSLLTDTKGGKTEWSEVKEEVIGLYFSAHWVSKE